MNFVKLKRFEIALLLGVIVAFALSTVSAADSMQNSVSDKLIRLHVIANSDSAEDQARKLEVRDTLVPLVSELLDGVESTEEAEARLAEAFPALQAAAEQALAENGAAGTAVAVELCDSYFPTKEYDGFSLPAGCYRALRVVIGEGVGQNWWCVLFPPLCLPASSESPEQMLMDSGFSQGEIALVTEQEGYRIRFKTAELLGEFKEWIGM